MPMIVRAYPLIASVEEVTRFAAALHARPTETASFYTQFGISHESWHVQQAPTGAQLICVTVSQDPVEAAPRYAAVSHEFDAWFKQQVHRLSGIDPNTQPLGPPSAQVFEWPAPAHTPPGIAGAV